jgi:thiol-disulfide isomerase/thioredoxin
MAKKVIVYLRSDCSLCEAVAMELEQMHTQFDFNVEYRDVDSHEIWRQKYDQLVPVICDERDHELCHFFLDPQKLAEYFS